MFENVSTEREIKALYRKEAKRLHPDLGGSAEAFRILNANYQKAMSDRKAQVTTPTPSQPRKSAWAQQVSRERTEWLSRQEELRRKEREEAAQFHQRWTKVA